MVLRRHISGKDDLFFHFLKWFQLKDFCDLDHTSEWSLRKCSCQNEGFYHKSSDFADASVGDQLNTNFPIQQMSGFVLLEMKDPHK